MAERTLFDPATARDCPQGKLPRGTLGLVLLTILMVVALLGYLAGGKSPVMLARAGQANLVIDTPVRLRNGLFFEQRLRVEAHAPIADAVIGVDTPLWHDITVNSMIPAASEEGVEDGQYRLHYGPLKAGDTLIVKIDAQINPPLTVGTRGTIALYDGERRIAAVPLTLRVLP